MAENTTVKHRFVQVHDAVTGQAVYIPLNRLAVSTVYVRDGVSGVSIYTSGGITEISFKESCDEFFAECDRAEKAIYDAAAEFEFRKWDAARNHLKNT